MTSEAVQLAQTVTTFLVPFLPYLVKAGEKAAEEAGKHFEAAVWEKAKSLWRRLKPEIEAKPATLEAAKDVAQDPGAEDAQAALRLQLKKLFTEDVGLAASVSEFMADSVVQRVVAERDSYISGVEQDAAGEGHVRQDIIAADRSTIIDAKQTKQ